MVKKKSRITDTTRKILSDTNHRTGSTKECPHCGHVSNPNEWLARIYGKTNTGETNYAGETKFKVVSPCPKCHELSWAHFTDETLHVYSLNPKVKVF